MNWQTTEEEWIRQLSPEIGRFVYLTLCRLERENVFDAPGVIYGVLRAMRIADSDAIRRAAPHTERLLMQALAPRRVCALGA